MCSRDFTGSASIPASPNRLVAVVLTRSRIRSLSSTISALGAANDFNTDTGIPAWLPGV